MKPLIFITACFFTISSFAQTKLIAHRSHSGSDANFRTAVENDLFDTGRSNFGIVSPTYRDIDTVILKNSNQIIVFKKFYYKLVNGKPYRPVAVQDTLDKRNAAILFKDKNMDSLKAQIQKRYQTYKLNDTRFIGFGKKFKQKNG